jgi:hypothetical protein
MSGLAASPLIAHGFDPGNGPHHVFTTGRTLGGSRNGEDAREKEEQV